MAQAYSLQLRQKGTKRKSGQRTNTKGTCLCNCEFSKTITILLFITKFWNVNTVAQVSVCRMKMTKTGLYKRKGHYVEREAKRDDTYADLAERAATSVGLQGED